jgi:xanthine dioxygenase
MAVKTLEVKPFSTPENSSLNLGAEINNVDLEHLSEEDFKTIRNALYNHHVVVLKNQAGLSPKAQYDLTRRFDPTAGKSFPFIRLNIVSNHSTRNIWSWQNS